MNETNLLAIRNGLVQKHNTVINRIFTVIGIMLLLLTIVILNVDDEVSFIGYIIKVLLPEIGIVIFVIKTIVDIFIESEIGSNINKFDKLYLEGKNEKEIIEELELLPQKEQEKSV